MRTIIPRSAKALSVLFVPWTVMGANWLVVSIGVKPLIKLRIFEALVFTLLPALVVWLIPNRESDDVEPTSSD